MDRVKDFASTGVAPDGVLYAGDLNAMQDGAAALSDLLQHIDLASISLGESGLQLLKYGAGEARLTGRLRTDGYALALGGVMPGSFTTTQRDAIPLGQRPTNLIIKNSTTGTVQMNVGSDGTPSWIDIGGASVALTGTPTAPTPTLGDNTTKIATMAAIQAALAAVGPWADYTPVWTSASGTAPNLGNSVVYARWCQIGKTVFAKIVITFGSGASYGDGAQWFFTLPTAAAAGMVATFRGMLGTYTAVKSNGSKLQLGPVFIGADATHMKFGSVSAVNGADQNASAVAPFTWASGDFFSMDLKYEAA